MNYSKNFIHCTTPRDTVPFDISFILDVGTQELVKSVAAGSQPIFFSENHVSYFFRPYDMAHLILDIKDYMKKYDISAFDAAEYKVMLEFDASAQFVRLIEFQCLQA